MTPYQKRIRELRNLLTNIADELNEMVEIDARSAAGELIYTLDECVYNDDAWAELNRSVVD